MWFPERGHSGDLSLGADTETCTLSMGDTRAPRDIHPSIHPWDSRAAHRVAMGSGLSVSERLCMVGMAQLPRRWAWP